jgi:DNA recombination protein RmuC
VVELLLVALGLAGGVVLAWVVAGGHFRAAAAAEREVIGARLAAAETLGDELRKQLTQRELEIIELRQAADSERMLRTQADTRFEAARQSVEEQRRLLDDARERLAETFKALSADALQASNTAFLQLAQETLGHRQEAIDAMVRPLHDALQRYDEELHALEAKRERAYGGLAQQLESLARTSADLQKETGNLVSALRVPQVRGRWGELTLQRVVELAGMTEYCDYLEQVTAEGENGRLRPDMIVYLPNGREIIVDAKVPLTAYLDAAGASAEEDRQAALQRHAQQVRQHMNALASKAYWEEFGKAAEFVVMFIPGESFVAAAAQADGALLEDGMAKRVVVATPTTLIALLRAIAFGWRQEQLATNAAQISALGRELYDRLRAFVGHFDEVGDKLGKATAAFNRAVGSLESRVLPAARRFRDLGAAGGAELAILEPVDTQPHQLAIPELPRQLDVPEPRA